jgi:hypothetical protein
MSSTNPVQPPSWFRRNAGLLIGVVVFVAVISATAVMMDSTATKLPGPGEGSKQPGHEGHDHP